MNGTTGYPDWGMWAVMIVGTTAFWAVTFLAVRALFDGRSTPASQDCDGSQEPDPWQERLARGEITLEEYVQRSAETGAFPGRPSYRPPHC